MTRTLDIYCLNGKRGLGGLGAAAGRAYLDAPLTKAADDRS